MNLPELITYFKEWIEEKQGEGENMDATSWNYEEGIIISGNEAKFIVEFYEEHNPQPKPQPHPPGSDKEGLTIKTH